MSVGRQSLSTPTSRKRQRREGVQFVQPRSPKRLRLTVIGDGDAQRVHRAALRVLSGLGVIVDDVGTREMLVRDNGCVAADDGYVRFPEELVATALDTVPPRLKLFDRNGNLAVDTSDDIPRFCVGHNCVNILDHRTGKHRSGTLADIVNTARVCERLSNIDVVASLGYPSDVPVDQEAIATARTVVENTRKPFAFTGHDEHEAAEIWAILANSVGGWTEFADKPCGIDLTGPLSPLKLGEEFCRRLKFAAQKSLPIVCFPAIFPGMSGPITLAGSIVQAAAESLAGVVVHQLYGAGSPIMCGSSILPMDMRSADLAYGSPELVLSALGLSDYFKSIGVPSWVGAGCSDSHITDLQAAAEVGANMTVAALAGTSFIHRLGFLSAGRTGSLEMLVLCNELAGMVSKIGAGIDVSDESLAVEVIERAGRDNSFLTDTHTMERYRHEMWMPDLFQRASLPVWAENGAPDLILKIKQHLSSILD